MAKEKTNTRPIDELVEMSVKSMTGSEAKKLVTHLREQLILEQTKNDELKHNIESTRKQDQENIKRAEAMERYYMRRFQYIEEAVRNLKESIDLVTKGDIA